MTITRVSALRWRVMRELRFCLVFTQPQTQTNVLLARHFILSPLCLFKLARYDRGCRLHIKRLTSRSSKPPRRQMSPSSLRRKGQDALLMSAASSEYSKGPGRRVVCVFCTGIVCERERERPLITQMHIGGSANALHTRGRFAFVRAAAAAFGSRVGGGGKRRCVPRSVFASRGTHLLDNSNSSFAAANPEEFFVCYLCVCVSSVGGSCEGPPERGGVELNNKCAELRVVKPLIDKQGC